MGDRHVRGPSCVAAQLSWFYCTGCTALPYSILYLYSVLLAKLAEHVLYGTPYNNTNTSIIIIIILHFISLEPAFWATLPLYCTKTLFQLPPTTIILYMPCDVMMSIATTLHYYQVIQGIDSAWFLYCVLPLMWPSSSSSSSLSWFPNPNATKSAVLWPQGMIFAW